MPVAPQALRILQEQKHQWGGRMDSPSPTKVRAWSWQAGTRRLLSGLAPVLTPGWPGACLDFSSWPDWDSKSIPERSPTVEAELQEGHREAPLGLLPAETRA